MFTGIIKEIGTIKTTSKDGDNILVEIQCKNLLDNINEGDSINVNGICSTVTKHSADSFFVSYMPETLSKTNAGKWNNGTKVNLEPALCLADKLNGHFVMGHVDSTGLISEIKESEKSKDITIKFPRILSKHIALKGSITIDGISLTISLVDDNKFTVSLIPHTIDNTTLGSKEKSEIVNLEIDMVSRYLKRLFDERDEETSYEYLKERGFI